MSLGKITRIKELSFKYEEMETSLRVYLIYVSHESEPVIDL